jgi:adenylosuccinate synthase
MFSGKYARAGSWRRVIKHEDMVQTCVAEAGAATMYQSSVGATGTTHGACYIEQYSRKLLRLRKHELFSQACIFTLYNAIYNARSQLWTSGYTQTPEDSNTRIITLNITIAESL